MIDEGRGKVRTFIRDWIPPVLLRKLRQEKGVKWSAPVISWGEAMKRSSGYDSNIILDRVKDSLTQVRDGKAVYERDSVLFDHVQHSWPLLAAMMWIAAQKSGELNVLDFGGSLGSTYYQNRVFLDGLGDLSWSIVEQKPFVEAGRKGFEIDSIRFFSSIEECLQERRPEVILLSSVLQYLENPHELLRKIISHGFEFILLDRTPFSRDEADSIRVQTVPPEIYPASYPCWFFSKPALFGILENSYQLVARFDSFEDYHAEATFEGAVFRMRG
jgi:putative methyltransferase (TIGR04325 family)